MAREDWRGYLERDFAAALETVALAAGLRLTPDNVTIATGLEVDKLNRADVKNYMTAYLENYKQTVGAVYTSR